MKIKKINGLTARDLQQEEEKGGRFIHYCYTVSLLVITLKRKSGVYLVKSGEKASRKGFVYTLLTALFGWWGIPYGPAFTLESIRTNLKGGIDVTDEVMQTVNGYLIFQEVQQHKQQETAFNR